jgi:hypothetical protein
MIPDNPINVRLPRVEQRRKVTRWQVLVIVVLAIAAVYGAYQSYLNRNVVVKVVPTASGRIESIPQPKLREQSKPIPHRDHDDPFPAEPR